MGSGYGGQSMVGRLGRVVVARPEVAGWGEVERAGRWRELGYLRAPEAVAAEGQHGELRRVLAEAGAEVVELDGAADLSLDAVYVHDASLATDRGAILLRMGKAARNGEPERHGELYRQLGVPILGRLEEPATAEGGDLVWLDGKTLLAGRGYRTNAAGIEQLRALLAPLGVEVIEAPLPHGDGPASCLHLMSLLSMLDETTALVDLAWLAVSTVEELQRRKIDLIEIEPSERASLACNVLALGDRRLLAFEGSPRTAARLRARGFDLITVPGGEIGVNGSGGPTCLTRPLLRT